MQGFRKKLSRWGFSAGAVLVLCVLLFPIVWMLPAAFKTKTEIWKLPLRFLPDSFYLGSFERLFSLRDMNFWSTMGMTFLVSVVSVALSLLVTLLAAFAFARIEFRGKRLLFGYILMMMFVPGTTILLTSLQVVNGLDMVDTFWVLILPGAVAPYNIFFFRQFFFGMPSSLEEAAVIDGSSMPGIFFRIFLPMSVTPVIIIGFGGFIAHWNDYMWPVLTVSNNAALKQVMQVIYVLEGRFNGDYGVVIAAASLALAVPLIGFAFAQRRIVEGIAIYGLK